VEPFEALAESCLVAARAATRAVSASFISIASHGICFTWALPQRTIGPTIAGIAHTTPYFHSIPRKGIISACSFCKYFHWQAETSVITIVEATVPLASQSLKRWPAMTFSGVAVALSSIRAFHPWMCIIVSNHLLRRPSMSFRTCSHRAINTKPNIFAIQVLVTTAIITLRPTLTVTIAVIFAEAYSPISLLVKNGLV